MNRLCEETGLSCRLMVLCFILHALVVSVPVCLAFAPQYFSPSCNSRVRVERCHQAAAELSAHFLNTAFEWLAEERYSDVAYQEIAWIDPSSSDNINDEDRNEDTMEHGARGEEEEWIMPLYPLGATYLPCHLNFTLNNVEPRNIRMALDLMNKGKNINDDNNNSINASIKNRSSNETDRRFCVVLRTTDTGRISSVGTVMRIMDAEQHVNVEGDISRIVVTCCAEQIVDIVSIENPDAASYKNRFLLRSPEYLRARVRIRKKEEQDFDCETTTISDLIRNYDAVRYYYMEGEIGSTDLPPFARSKISQDMPRWTKQDFTTPISFWKVANAWQTLCHTVREGRQLLLAADRNEIMIDAATSMGGPLKLPIHMEDLNPTVQRTIQEMEVQEQENFIKMGLDPCLDFQALLSMSNYQDRVLFLGRMVQRERDRLERLREEKQQQQDQEELLWNAFNDNDDDDDDDDETICSEYPRKGAWFQDDY